MKEFNSLLNEDVSQREDCAWCREIPLAVGQKTGYGAVVVYRIGEGKNGWFATLSPKTGGSEKDFTIQLMTQAHLTHFAQIDSYPELAKNYGTAFARIAKAMTSIMAEEQRDFKAASAIREESASVATYGKSTTWKEKKEHLHIKLFPFRGNVGQPYTVDSTFGKKVIHKDEEGEYVKMKPVKKVMIDEKRFEVLAKQLISLFKKDKAFITNR